jgi:hypothetical protein
LIKLLQKIVGYSLVKVRKCSSFSDYLLDDNTTGLYICKLETKINTKTHVVAIDCDNKTVFDCMEDYSLYLTKENLDYCCGQDAIGLKSISSCFCVMKQRKSKMKA